MAKGILICTNSNIYRVQVNNQIYNCLLRGKFRKEKIIPLVGDNVEISITSKVLRYNRLL